MHRCTVRMCKNLFSTLLCTILTTTPTLGPEAGYKTNASRGNLILRSALIGLLQRLQTPGGGTVKSPSKTRTNIGIRPFQLHSGTNVWRLTQRVTAVHR